MSEPSITDLPPDVFEAVVRPSRPKLDTKKLTYRQARDACPEAHYKTHRRCSRCGRYKLHEEYSPKNHRCKPCQAAVMRGRRQKQRFREG